MKRGKKNGTKTVPQNFNSLEQFFGSKTRFWLLKTFCEQPEKEFFVRELARLVDNQLNAVRREIANLADLGIIKEGANKDLKKRFYRLNTNFILVDEISSLLSKSDLLAEKKLIDFIATLGNLDLCILTGRLVGEKNAPCDVLLVGRVDRAALARAVQGFEREVGKTVAYTIFSPEEYRQRKSLTDKFLFNVFEGKKIVVADKYGEFPNTEKL